MGAEPHGGARVRLRPRRPGVRGLVSGVGPDRRGDVGRCGRRGGLAPRGPADPRHPPAVAPASRSDARAARARELRRAHGPALRRGGRGHRGPRRGRLVEDPRGRRAPAAAPERGRVLRATGARPARGGLLVEPREGAAGPPCAGHDAHPRPARFGRELVDVEPRGRGARARGGAGSVPPGPVRGPDRRPAGDGAPDRDDGPRARRRAPVR